MIFPLFAIYLAGSAAAGVIQVRQDASSGVVASHANSATANLLAPGYTGFYWPESRGYNRSTHREFCGGFPVDGSRADFPLSGGRLSLVQQKAVTNLKLMYSTVADPTSLADFTAAGENSTLLGVGLSCTQAPNFASLGLAAGSPITFYMEYTYGTHQYQYNQCSDVTLVANEDFVGNVLCVNAMVSQSDADLMSNGTLLAATEQFDGTSFDADDNDLSAAAAGGIGASVTLLVCFIFFAGLFFLGAISFGKKRSQIALKDTQSNDSGSFNHEKRSVA